MADLHNGYTIATKSGKAVKVIDKIGEGGQGAVYKVECNGEFKALKWYSGKKIRDPKKFYDNLYNNVKKGAPTSAFLWPLDITEKDGEAFGYVMDLRPGEYKDFTLFLLAKEKFASVTASVNAALHITAGFRELHNKGYSYQDLNDGNFFINPKTGAVLICDNDNVSEYGKSSGIAGKARYMAPEIVTGKSSPGVKSDSFSLAVVLFQLFVMSHPFEGRKTCVPCMTEKLEKEFFGEKPIFIYDSVDNSNSPEPGIHRNAIKRWKLYPPCLREMFQKAFNKQALNDPNYRVLEIDWIRLFIRLRAEIFKCSCGEVFFADALQETPCPACGKKNRFSMYMKTARYNVPLHQRTKLFTCHTEAESNDFATLTAEVNQKNGVFEIKNISNKAWIVSDNGRQFTVAHDSSLNLRNGMIIDFGGSTAQIL
jgi:serine/threonine protein kinase